MLNAVSNVLRTQEGDVPSFGGGLSSGLATVNLPELDYTKGALVKGIGFRFVIPVPDLGAENQTHEVKDYKGNPKTVVGYKFNNGTDSGDQAVVGDGTGVIMVLIKADEIDGHDASRQILAKVAELGGVQSLNVTKLDSLIAFINTSLRIVDTYDSDDKQAGTMVPQVGYTGEGERPFGYFQKNEKPGPLAIYVEGAVNVFGGPHLEGAKYEDGFMAVQMPPKKEGLDPTYRSIHPSAITNCYELADGTKITDPAKQLPTVSA